MRTIGTRDRLRLLWVVTARANSFASERLTAHLADNYHWRPLQRASTID